MHVRDVVSAIVDWKDHACARSTDRNVAIAIDVFWHPRAGAIVLNAVA
jgi:hypothetical protein